MTPRVMIADDQEQIVNLLKELLTDAGCEVIATAADGAAAVELAAMIRPDSIVMDVRMPKLDGLAATAKIMQRDPVCRIIVLTAFDDATLRREASEAGAAAFLLKGAPFSELLDALRRT